jgi:hypothetical protein
MEFSQNYRTKCEIKTGVLFTCLFLGILIGLIMIVYEAVKTNGISKKTLKKRTFRRTFFTMTMKIQITISRQTLR